MEDLFKRNIDYMRVSITDRCNLRCKYCMPDDLPSTPHEEILQYEETLRICTIMAGAGIRTIKVTGGEPLVRKGCVDFLRSLKGISGVENVTLTTNGILFPKYVKELAEIGIDGVNLSLDSLSAETYKALTGSDEFDTVMRSVHLALDAGLRVKVNSVIVKGFNESDVVSLAGLAEKYPIDVRFIELMPKGYGKYYGSVVTEEVLQMLLRKYPDLTPDNTQHGFGPAKYLKSSKLKGGVGFISAMSGHFCESCNRVRLSSDGFLKLCLYHEDGLDIKSLLRSGASDAEIESEILNAIDKKPEKHFFDSEAALQKTESMSRIGG